MITLLQLRAMFEKTRDLPDSALVGISGVDVPAGFTVEGIDSMVEGGQTYININITRHLGEPPRGAHPRAHRSGDQS